MLVLKFLLQVDLLRDFLTVLQLQVDHILLEVDYIIFSDSLEPFQQILILLLKFRQPRLILSLDVEEFILLIAFL